MAASADIQVAKASFVSDDIQCGTFDENLTTGFFSETNAAPGSITPSQPYCLKNVGSQNVTLSVLVDELTDVEVGCTGDESLHGDASCGSGGAGELSSVLRVNYSELECSPVSGPGSSPFMKDNAVTPHPLGTIAPGATRCFGLALVYLAGTPTANVQKAQSDKVTWRYKWVAQA